MADQNEIERQVQQRAHPRLREARGHEDLVEDRQQPGRRQTRFEKNTLANVRNHAFKFFPRFVVALKNRYEIEVYSFLTIQMNLSMQLYALVST